MDYGTGSGIEVVLLVLKNVGKGEEGRGVTRFPTQGFPFKSDLGWPNSSRILFLGLDFVGCNDKVTLVVLWYRHIMSYDIRMVKKKWSSA